MQILMNRGVSSEFSAPSASSPKTPRSKGDESVTAKVQGLKFFKESSDFWKQDRVTSKALATVEQSSKISKKDLDCAEGAVAAQGKILSDARGALEKAKP